MLLRTEVTTAQLYLLAVSAKTMLAAARHWMANPLLPFFSILHTQRLASLYQFSKARQLTN